MQKTKGYILLGCLVIFISIMALIVVWQVFYHLQRTGECRKLGRQLTDREFLEAAMNSERMREWTGGQSLKAIMDPNPDRCCFVVRDQSELFREDRETFGSYIVEITIRFVQHNSIRGLDPKRPYKTASLYAGVCGEVGDGFLAEENDPQSPFYPY